MSILTKAHTLSEDDVKNHLDKCYKNNNIRVTRVYRNYYRGIYQTLKPETVQNAVTQIVPFFKNNAIKLIWWLYKTYRALSEREIVELKREIAALDITKIASRNITTFNHTARRLWVLCNTYHNPIDDLFQKVRDSYKQCALAPGWLIFTEQQNTKDLTFDVYLTAEENKYIEHMKTNHGCTRNPKLMSSP